MSSKNCPTPQGYCNFSKQDHPAKEGSSIKKKGDDSWCTSCGGVGHQANHCHMKGRGAPSESTAKHRMATLTEVKQLQHVEDTVPKDSTAVEVDAIPTQATVTMQGLMPESRKPSLGPMINTKVA